MSEHKTEERRADQRRQPGFLLGTEGAQSLRRRPPRRGAEFLEPADQVGALERLFRESRVPRHNRPRYSGGAADGTRCIAQAGRADNHVTISPLVERRS